MDPYAPRLSELLNAKRKVHVTEQGFSGERVTASEHSTCSMPERLEEQLVWGATHKHQYHWVILLGGTNDIYHRAPVEDIQEGLANAWRIALAHGARVLALTVPEVRFGHHDPKRWEEMYRAAEAARVRLNAGIQQEARAEEFRGRVVVVDLAAALPQFTMGAELRARLWETDEVHLTAEGYMRMADIIAAALVPLLGE